MAKTNIERFDEMSADILAFLYDSQTVSLEMLYDFAVLMTLFPAKAG